MKHTIKLLGLFVLLAVVFSSCVSVQIRSSLTSVIAGGSISLRVSGSDVEVSVSSTPDGMGTVASGTFVSSRGLLSVDPRENALFLYVIARSMKDNKTDTIQIRVVTVDSVSVTPAAGTATAGRTLQFASQVTGTNNPDRNVTWRVASSADGLGGVSSGTTINSSGLLSVAREEPNSVVYVSATSSIDVSKRAVVPVNIVVPTVTSVTVTPENPILIRGASFQFTATVIGQYDPDTTVTWRVSSTASGTGAVAEGTVINAQGQLTVAPNETASTLFIFATSTYDSTKIGRVMTFDILGVPTQPPPAQ